MPIHKPKAFREEVEIEVEIDEKALNKTVKYVREFLADNLDMFVKTYCQKNNIEDWQGMTRKFRIFLLKTNEGRQISDEPIKTIWTPIIREIRRRRLKVTKLGLYPLLIDDDLIKAMQHVIYERANYENAFAKKHGGLEASKAIVWQRIKAIFLSIFA